MDNSSSEAATEIRAELRTGHAQGHYKMAGTTSCPAESQTPSKISGEEENQPSVFPHYKSQCLPVTKQELGFENKVFTNARSSGLSGPAAKVKLIQVSHDAECSAFFQLDNLRSDRVQIQWPRDRTITSTPCNPLPATLKLPLIGKGHLRLLSAEIWLRPTPKIVTHTPNTFKTCITPLRKFLPKQQFQRRNPKTLFLPPAPFRFPSFLV